MEGETAAAEAGNAAMKAADSHHAQEHGAGTTTTSSTSTSTHSSGAAVAAPAAGSDDGTSSNGSSDVAALHPNKRMRLDSTTATDSGLSMPTLAMPAPMQMPMQMPLMMMAAGTTTTPNGFHHPTAAGSPTVVHLAAPNAYPHPHLHSPMQFHQQHSSIAVQSPNGTLHNSHNSHNNGTLPPLPPRSADAGTPRAFFGNMDGPLSAPLYPVPTATSTATPGPYPHQGEITAATAASGSPFGRQRTFSETSLVGQPITPPAIRSSGGHGPPGTPGFAHSPLVQPSAMSPTSVHALGGTPKTVTFASPSVDSSYASNADPIKLSELKQKRRRLSISEPSKRVPDFLRAAAASAATAEATSPSTSPPPPPPPSATAASAAVEDDAATTTTTTTTATAVATTAPTKPAAESASADGTSLAPIVPAPRPASAPTALAFSSDEADQPPSSAESSAPSSALAVDAKRDGLFAPATQTTHESASPIPIASSLEPGPEAIPASHAGTGASPVIPLLAPPPSITPGSVTSPGSIVVPMIVIKDEAGTTTQGDLYDYKPLSAMASPYSEHAACEASMFARSPSELENILVLNVTERWPDAGLTFPRIRHWALVTPWSGSRGGTHSASSALSRAGSANELGAPSQLDHSEPGARSPSLSARSPSSSSAAKLEPPSPSGGATLSSPRDTPSAAMRRRQSGVGTGGQQQQVANNAAAGATDATLLAASDSASAPAQPQAPAEHGGVPVNNSAHPSASSADSQPPPPQSIRTCRSSSKCSTCIT
ncbi:hypothetical protein CAOG_009843 [Capsaspora owczarzaki ATCC 30864]|uniref:Uncharacterized protein n=1 Tax=Capsaspora owczarzaki (strain ATCC 30864) TaxID=595528 RepID=A0A0D2UI25_CAPO3|nr:hypothetical protein CAOG_009843 [Capsaspora owczarzaki ATCC 30864]